MADLKISGLPASTTPLAGTEVLPIVQSSTTKQVSVANLTAGRAVRAASLALTTSPLPATSGGTGASSAFTANGVAYASSTSALATGSAFLFDGTNVLLGTASQIKAGLLNIAGSSGAVTQVVVADTQAYNASPTPAVSFAAKYASSGAYENVSGIRGYREDTTDGSKLGGISFLTNSGTYIAERFRIGSDGNLVPATAAKGINFTANTPAAGMTSQLLNWYEEGTWTPALSSNATGVTYSSRAGSYTRVGNRVTVFFKIALSAIGGSGSVWITGLPFTPYTDDGNAGVFAMSSGGASISGTCFMLALAGDTNLYLYYQGATDRTNLAVANFTSSSVFSGTITYRVA